MGYQGPESEDRVRAQPKVRHRPLAATYLFSLGPVLSLLGSGIDRSVPVLKGRWLRKRGAALWGVRSSPPVELFRCSGFSTIAMLVRSDFTE